MNSKIMCLCLITVAAFLGCHNELVAPPLSALPADDGIAVDVSPVPTQSINPSYPSDARAAGLEGTVWLKVYIGTDGVPQKADVVKSDHQELNQSAIDAAMQWRFTPAMREGNPIAVWVAIPFRFKKT